MAGITPPSKHVLMIVIMCAFTLRGISACSLLIEQVEILTDEKTIIVTLLKRKNCQEVSPWQVPSGVCAGGRRPAPPAWGNNVGSPDVQSAAASTSS